MEINIRNTLFNKLSKVNSFILGKPVSVYPVSSYMSSEIGYANPDGIYLNTEHKILGNYDENEQIVINSIENISERMLFAEINNIIEDPAIEYQGRYYLSAKLMECLSFSIKKIWELSSPLGNEKHPYTQFMKALIQYCDCGIVKGKFTFPEAKDVFIDIINIVDEAITESDFDKRLEYSMTVYEKAKILFKEESKDEELMENLMDELSQCLTENGKNDSMSTGEGEPIIKPQHEKGDDKHSENRKATKEKFLKQLQQKMQQEDNNSEGKKTNITEGSKAYTIGKNNESDNSENTEGKETGSTESKETESLSLSPFNDEKDTGDMLDTDNHSNKKTNDESTNNTKDVNNNDAEASSDDDSQLDDINLENDSLINSQYEKSDNKNKFESSSQVYTSFNQDIDTECDDEDIVDKDKVTISEETLREVEAIINKTNKSNYGFQSYDKTVLENYQKEISQKYKGVKVKNTYVDITPYFDRLNSLYTSVIKNTKKSSNRLKKELLEIFISDTSEKEFKKKGKISLDRSVSRPTSINMFTQKSEPKGKRNCEIVILADISGSTSNNNKLTNIRNSIITITEAIESFYIPITVIGFNEPTHYDHENHFFMVKKNTRAERVKLMAMKSSGSNFDSYAIRYANTLLKKSKAEHKLLIVLSDGQPESQYCKRNKINAFNDTCLAVEEAKKNISVVGILVGNSDKEVLKKIYGNDFIHIEEPSDLPNHLCKVLKNQIKKW